MENIVTNNINHLEQYIRVSHKATGEFGNYVVQDEYTEVHNENVYVKYVDSDDNVYWYNEEDETIYNSEWVLQDNVNVKNLTKVSDWLSFPTPSEMPYTLNDVDKDPFTDLRGFTHRNRVRIDVLSINLNYKYLNEDTQAYVLQAIEPEWFYIEIIHPKTKKRSIHKVYASSKKFNVFKVIQNESGEYVNDYIDFQVTLVEE